MIVRQKMLPKQLEFLRSTDREKIFMAGIGSGKTIVGCWWGWMRASSGRIVIMTEPTLGMCKKNLMPTMSMVFEKVGYREGTHYTLNKSDYEYSFKSGGKIYLCSGETPERLRGINAHDGLIDEFGSQADDDLYNILVGRCRNDENGQIRLTGTPTASKFLRSKVAEDPCKLIRQTTIENIFLPKSYIQSLKDTYGEDSLYYRQEVLGEIVDFGNGIFDISKITISPIALPVLNKRARAWDMASSSKSTADWTACALLSKHTSGKVNIHDVWRKKGAYATLRDWMINVMRSDPPGTTQWIENTQAGQVVLSDLMSDSRCANIDIRLIDAVKDKVTRSLPLSARVANGLVSMTQGSWNRDALDEMAAFPNVDHDDQVDAMSHAYNALDEMIEAQTTRANIY